MKEFGCCEVLWNETDNHRSHSRQEPKIVVRSFLSRKLALVVTVALLCACCDGDSGREGDADPDGAVDGDAELGVDGDVEHGDAGGDRDADVDAEEDDSDLSGDSDVPDVDQDREGDSFTGETYYISNDGDDESGDGSRDAPWASLFMASISVGEGERILLRRGDRWLVTRSRRPVDGSPPGEGFGLGCGLWIMVDNAVVGAYGDGEKPIIDATAQTGIDSTRQIQAYSPVVIGVNGGHHSAGVTVSDLDLRGAAEEATIHAYSAGANTTISRCSVSGAGWSAEALVVGTDSVDNMVIEDCFFDQITGNSSGYSKSIEIRGGGGHVVRGNVFHGFGTGGALRFAHDWNGEISVEGNFFYRPDSRVEYANAVVARNADGDTMAGTMFIRNNVISLRDAEQLTGNNLIGILIYYIQSPSHFRIFNNTIVGSGEGYGIKGDGTTMEVVNNIIHSVGRAHDNAETGVTHRNNILHGCNDLYDNVPDIVEGEQIDDPHLANPTMSSNSADDAQLTAASASAIDMGFGTAGVDGLPELDFGGHLRADIDIGAWEFR